MNAQEAEPSNALEEITVTGSRIVRRDLEANSPIMTVDEQIFDETMSIGVEHMLNQLPQFVPAVTQFDVQNIQPGPTSTPGASTLSLRGLGSNRNLVLIDGRRGMPVNASGAVDTNTIPSAAIARVETITGGASSVYGADAMAGVVNFILKRDYEGMDLDLRYGATEEGGGEEVRLAGLYGANLAGDNGGNVLLGFEYANRERVMHVDREFYRNIMAEPTVVGTETGWGATAFVTTSLPGSGLPANAPSAAAVAQVFGVPVSEVTRPGGIGTTGTFYYNYANPSGTVYRLNAPGSSRYNGPLVLDDGVTYRKYRTELNPAIANQNGSLVENQLLRDVSIPLERWAMFGRGTVGLTDKTSAFAQVNFSQDETNTLQEEAAASGGRGTQIPYGTGIYAPSVDAGGNTLAAYLPGGAFGLNCAPTGGCTNSQAFPVKPELATLLNSRPQPEFAVATLQPRGRPRPETHRELDHVVSNGRGLRGGDRERHDVGRLRLLGRDDGRYAHGRLRFSRALPIHDQPAELRARNVLHGQSARRGISGSGGDLHVRAADHERVPNVAGL